MRLTVLPLHRGQLSVLRVRGFLVVLVLIMAVLAADLGPLRETKLPFGATSGPVALLLILWVLWSPGRRYRSWGYSVEDDELHIRHGLWTRMRTIVPFGRVQHIDLAQGPIERHFGVSRLILHTAGTRSSAVGLPGLARAEAERIRDVIRSQIRQDLM
jgi:membrane protein YdbS with pleckstrin-like domain